MGKIILNGTEYGGSGGSGGVIYLPTIYSEEEREVGVWKDGKPLYQKTIPFTTGNSNAYLNYVTDIENPEMMSIDFSASFYVTGNSIVNATPYFGTLGAGDSNAFAVLCGKVDDKLRLDYRVGSSAYSKTALVTVRYTKTTDTAGSGTWTPSGANAVHYSTNEQVIGTWIDGKPLYEKVVKSTTTPTANAWNPVALPADISVKTFDAYYVRTTGAVDKFSMYRGDTSPAEFLVFNIENGTLYYRIASQYIANFSEFVSILQYTKTTD